jgi:DNA-binding NtrC family response regulator
MPEIVITRGRAVFRKARLETSILTLGRAKTMDVIFLDTKVSRSHARITRGRGGFYLEDMRSRFGTLLNGRAIEPEKKHRLEDGSVVKLGNSELRIGIAPGLEKPPAFILKRSAGDSVERASIFGSDGPEHRLGTATQEIFSGLREPDLLPQTILDALVSRISLEEAGVGLRKPSGGNAIRVHAEGGRGAESRRKKIAAQIADALDQDQDAIPSPGAIEQLEKSSELWVPLSSGGKLHGIIYGKAAAGGFSDNDRGFLFEFEKLASSACQNARLLQEMRYSSELEAARTQELRSDLLRFYSSQRLIGSGKAYQALLEAIEDFKNINKEVLITGESGTGKEVVARALHAGGPRKDGPFVTVHLGALPKDLIASEIFGHEKGSFTGANERKIGKFELAQGGTLLLDEIGEIPQEVQIMLLRVLESKEFQRIGGNNVIKADFRLICATNRNLEEAVEQKFFRKDLLYRINFIRIHLPPLRERREDIPVLTEYFLDDLAREMQLKRKAVTKEAVEVLRDYEYPGNIRELKSILGRALILARGERIEPEDLPQELSAKEMRETASLAAKIPRNMEELRRLEKAMIRQVLEETGGNMKAAALRIGISRQALYQKLAAFGIARKPSPNRT